MRRISDRERNTRREWAWRGKRNLKKELEIKIERKMGIEDGNMKEKSDRDRR